MAFLGNGGKMRTNNKIRKSKQLSVLTKILTRRQKEIGVLKTYKSSAELALLKCKGSDDQNKLLKLNKMLVKYSDRQIKSLRSQLKELEILTLESKEGII